MYRQTNVDINKVKMQSGEQKKKALKNETKQKTLKTFIKN